MKAVVSFFASLKLTVALFGMGIFILLAGTLAQIDHGIWTVVDNYFRTPLAYIPFQLFVPRRYEIPGGIYFLGGWSIGALLLINLFAAHVTRYRIQAKGGRAVAGWLCVLAALGGVGLLVAGYFEEQMASTKDEAFWRVLKRLIKGGGVAIIFYIGFHLLFYKRGAIVQIHTGVMILLLSELLTGLFAVEATMTIREGESVNFIDRSREWEFVVADTSPETHDQVTIVPHSKLVAGETLSHKDLPFDIKVEKVYVNSSQPFELREGMFMKNKNIATHGFGKTFMVMAAEEGKGVDNNQKTDTPSTYLTFIKKGGSKEKLGTYLFTLWLYPNHNLRQWQSEQHIELEGKRYELVMRYRREYLRSSPDAKPFEIKLNDFQHKKYLGTNIPSDYSSFVRLTDTDAKVDRELRIWMNNPLRYAGKTFYQASFLPDESGTVLQVVHNTGWLLPYISCMVVAIGLMVHFTANLSKFLARQQS